MINLLSSEQIRDLRAARLNVKLVATLLYSIVIIALLACIFLFALWWCTGQQKNAQALAKVNANQSGIYVNTTTKAASFTSNLSSAKTVFTQQIKYSVILENIAKALPSGVALGGITLSPEVTASKLDLKATTNGYPEALSLQNQMKSSPIFTDVTLNVANCESSTCNATYTATLNPTAVVAEGTN